MMKIMFSHYWGLDGLKTRSRRFYLVTFLLLTDNVACGLTRRKK